MSCEFENREQCLEKPPGLEWAWGVAFVEVQWSARVDEGCQVEAGRPEERASLEAEGRKAPCEDEGKTWICSSSKPRGKIFSRKEFEMCLRTRKARTWGLGGCSCLSRAVGVRLG